MGYHILMSDSAWVAVIDEDKLPEGQGVAVFPKGLSVMLVKTGPDIYAVANKCAHMACQLTAGRLFGHTIECACHDWLFDIRTGESLDAPEIKIRVYEWKREDGRIFVNLGAES